MSTTINRSQIFRRVHEIARWRAFSAGKRVTYRQLFTDALRSEYRKLKQAKLREEQNLNGLPIASCRADLAPRHVSYMRASGYVVRAFAG
ncbi:MAG: hypothetical protein EKK29_05895 [Hyphomicrobiales bacterium]|nr:MAG: hypothetical protein EKK29_05895 [Hyphomicrobiales bacterium]